MDEDTSLDPLTEYCLESMDGTKSETEVFKSLEILAQIIRNGFYKKRHLSPLIAEAIDVKYVKLMMFKDDLSTETSIFILAYLCSEGKMFIYSEIIDLVLTFRQLLWNTVMEDIFPIIQKSIMTCVGFIIRYTPGKITLINAEYMNTFLNLIRKHRILPNVFKYLFELLNFLWDEMECIKGLTVLFRLLCVGEYFHQFFYDIMENLHVFGRYLTFKPGNEDRLHLHLLIWAYVNKSCNDEKVMSYLIEEELIGYIDPLLSSDFREGMNSVFLKLCAFGHTRMWEKSFSKMIRIREGALSVLRSASDLSIAACTVLNCMYDWMEVKLFLDFQFDSPQALSLHKGITKIFKMNLSSRHAAAALDLTLKIVDHYGLDWLLPYRTMIFDTSLFSIVYHLGCIHIKLIYTSCIKSAPNILVDLELVKKFIGHFVTLLFTDFNELIECFTNEEIKKFEVSLLNVYKAVLNVLENFLNFPGQHDQNKAMETSSLPLKCPIVLAMDIVESWLLANDEHMDIKQFYSTIITYFSVVRKLMDKFEEFHFQHLVIPLVTFMEYRVCDIFLETDLYQIFGALITLTAKSYMKTGIFSRYKMEAAYYAIMSLCNYDSSFLTNERFMENFDDLFRMLPSMDDRQDEKKSRGSMAVLGLMFMDFNKINGDDFRENKEILNPFLGSVLRFTLANQNSSEMDSLFFRSNQISLYFNQYLIDLKHSECDVDSRLRILQLLTKLCVNPYICELILNCGWIEAVLEEFQSISKGYINFQAEECLEALLVALVKPKETKNQYRALLIGIGVFSIKNNYKWGKLKNALRAPKLTWL